jgi:hypothetical protein
VFGWSKGYVAFEFGYNQYGQVEKALSYASSDGLTWHRGKPVSFANINSDWPDGPDNFYMVEGPAGLVVVGTEDDEDCGWAPPTIDVVLTSKDGLNWSLMSLKPFGDEGANYVAGGGAGYLATGSSQAVVNAAWTSTDLKTWHKVALDAAGFKDSLIQDGAVFSGGFVMTGYTWNKEGCTGTDPLMVKPTAWLSADGIAWSPVSLPGSSLGTNVETDIVRVTDHLLLVEASTSSGGKVTGSEDWISSDGVTWSQVPNPEPDVSYLIGDGVRAFAIHCPGSSLPGCAKSKPTIKQFDDTLVAKTVAQSGFTLLDETVDQWPSGDLAVGPTGFVYIADDGVWFGAPAAVVTSTPTPSPLPS